jgi:hypothetical protein
MEMPSINGIASAVVAQAALIGKGAKDVQIMLGDEVDCPRSAIVIIPIDQAVENVLVLRRPNYYGAQTGKTRQVARDWSITETADDFQLCSRRRELSSSGHTTINQTLCQP